MNDVRPRRIPIFLFSLTLAASLSARAGEAAFDPAAKPDVEVTRTKIGLLLVRPVINGQQAGWFIFDTGAGMGVVSTPYVEKLGLAEAGETSAIGTGGNANVKMHRADTLVLGPVTLSGVSLISTDLSFLKAHLGDEIAGIIGYEVLSACVVEIDADAPRIALHDPRAYKAPGAKWTPLKIESRIPTIEARLQDRPGRFRIDTGANDGLTIFEPTVRKWDLLAGREVTDAKLGGVGGFIAGKRGTVASFEVGGVRHENVPTMFVTEAKGASADAARDGRIGMGVLGSMTIVMDYGNERAWFRRPATSK